MSRRAVATALSIPSAYAVVGWLISACLYLSGAVPWSVPAERTLVFIAFATLIFGLSFVISMNRASRVSIALAVEAIPVRAELALHAAGLVGLILYIRDFADALGGIENFMAALLLESAKIRQQAADTTSIGTQISYFGWIAIAASFVAIRREGFSFWRIVLCLVQFAGNLLFIDRTRPTWILFSAAICALFAMGWPSRRAIVAGGTAVVIAVGVGFVALADWIGKIPDEHAYGSSALPPIVQNVIVYLTSGFAYFDRILTWPEPIDFSPVRTLSPLVNVLAALHLVPRAPSQVSEEYLVPFGTNVGTVLEPFYHDGGLTYAVFGLFVQAFVVDALAMRFLTARNFWARYAWASLCFSSAVSFFTPKITTSPVWLFVALGMIASWPWLNQSRKT